MVENGIGSVTENYKRIETQAGEALVRLSSEKSLSGIDGIIFDVDGVLIDVSNSIQLAHGKVAETYFSLLGWTDCEGMVTPQDVDAFKLARGFNSDWDLATAWVLLYLLKSIRYSNTRGSELRNKPPKIEEFTSRIARLGGGLDNARKVLQEIALPEEWRVLSSWSDRPLLEKVFQETYSGDLCPRIYGYKPTIAKGQGLIYKDRRILDKRFVPKHLKLGIATGRTLGETIVGLEIMGLSDLFSEKAIVTEDDRLWKPDPAVLKLAVERTGCQYPLYVGDTPDDLITVNNYRKLGHEIASCGVLTGISGGNLRQVFAEHKADMVADNVNAALLAIRILSGGAICTAEKRN
ncbi:MAG: HAD hydrolase-like protein [Armatimonadota bacterium]|nr:HAD hydrolase-like protein [Armatimonadota bacterium]